MTMTDEQCAMAVVHMLTTYNVGEIVTHVRSGNHRRRFARVVCARSKSGRSVLIQHRLTMSEGSHFWGLATWVKKSNLQRLDDDDE